MMYSIVKKKLDAPLCACTSNSCGQEILGFIFPCSCTVCKVNGQPSSVSALTTAVARKLGSCSFFLVFAQFAR